MTLADAIQHLANGEAYQNQVRRKCWVHSAHICKNEGYYLLLRNPSQYKDAKPWDNTRLWTPNIEDCLATDWLILI